MSTRNINIIYETACLAEQLDVAAIAELCFAVIRRILSYYSTLIPENTDTSNRINLFLANLHSYFCSIGMTPFFGHGNRSRIEIQCITLLYRGNNGIAPPSFEGVTTFQTLLVHHPRMVLDFAVIAVTEAIQAIKLKTRAPYGPEVFLEQIRIICVQIRVSDRIAPRMTPLQGTPCAHISLKVFPSR